MSVRVPGCSASELFGGCIPGCEIFELLGSLRHSVYGLLAGLCSHFELSGYLRVCVPGLKSPSCLVGSMQGWKTLGSLWVLNPRFVVSELRVQAL